MIVIDCELYCGRPYYRWRCRDCGSEIGGEGHRLIANNKLHDVLVFVYLV